MGARTLALVFVVGATAGCSLVLDFSQPIVPDAAIDGPPSDTLDAPPIDAFVADAVPCVAGDANAVDPNTGHCYMFFSASPQIWTDAKSLCEGLGPMTHLATVTSTAENDLVATLLGQSDTWMGDNDIQAEKDWQWITGETWSYTNWRMGEPNNGGANPPENCGILEGKNGGLWDDRACGTAYAYLCERD